MDLGRPVSVVVPSLDGPVLEVLAQAAEGLSGREVHRIAGVGSAAGVRLVLQRLAGTGLVHVDEVGNKLVYRLNRRHLLTPVVEYLADVRGALARRLTEEIASWAVQPVHASLYGAVARGDGDEDSDVDVLLIRPDDLAAGDDTWERQAAALMQYIVDLTGNAAHVYELSRRELVEQLTTGEPILNDWIQPSITLAGPPVQVLSDDFEVVLAGQ